MFCTHCGAQVGTDDRFCSKCGAAQRTGAVPTAARQLLRPRQGRKIAGVCLGFAYYLDLDPTLVRVLWLVAAFMSGGLGLIAYFVGWILMPEADYCPVCAARSAAGVTPAQVEHRWPG